MFEITLRKLRNVGSQSRNPQNSLLFLGFRSIDRNEFQTKSEREFCEVILCRTLTSILFVGENIAQ